MINDFNACEEPKVALIEADIWSGNIIITSVPYYYYYSNKGSLLVLFWILKFGFWQAREAVVHEAEATLPYTSCQGPLASPYRCETYLKS